MHRAALRPTGLCVHPVCEQWVGETHPVAIEGDDGAVLDVFEKRDHALGGALRGLGQIGNGGVGCRGRGQQHASRSVADRSEAPLDNGVQ